jgi:hypothetical protein
LKYISDKLIEELSFDGTINLKLCDQHKLRKKIRAHWKKTEKVEEILRKEEII